MENIGSNAFVSLNLLNNYVTKKYELDISPKILLKDYLEYRNYLRKYNINLPKIIDIKNVNKYIIISEEYTGENLKNSELTYDIKKYILSLTNDIPLDLHPGNITYYKERFFIVDLLPLYNIYTDRIIDSKLYKNKIGYSDTYWSRYYSSKSRYIRYIKYYNKYKNNKYMYLE